MEAASFDDTLGQLQKVVRGGLSEDQTIPVYSLEMYEVIVDFGARVGSSNKHVTYS